MVNKTQNLLLIYLSIIISVVIIFFTITKDRKDASQERLQIVSKLKMSELSMYIVKDTETKLEFLILANDGKVKNIFRIDTSTIDNSTLIEKSGFDKWSPTI